MRATAVVALLAALNAAVAAAAVPIRVEPGLEPREEVVRLGEQTWSALEKIVTPHGAPRARGAVVIERSKLSSGRAGESVIGRVSLRQAVPGVLSQAERTALKHELAHQLLLLRCPAADGDRLFHEAFAVATSGELEAWREGDYQSLSEAIKVLGSSKSLDAPTARRAMARLLAETQTSAGLPKSLESTLSRCDGRTAWLALTPSALAAISSGGGPAVVVMSRHTGEVLWSRGDISTPRPFGSILKPFIVAGASTEGPALKPRASDPEWACGEHEAKGASMSSAQAVLQSCNGYFLDWAQESPGIERFGAWGPVLQSVGLDRLPSDMSEAIGVRATLKLSPLAVAASYRLLAHARPDLVELMLRNAREGTMAGVPWSSDLIDLRVATKTGTVRDAQSRALYGWLVGVDRDVVVVQLEPGRAPRQFGGELAQLVRRAMTATGRDAVEVQVFGLVQQSDVELACARGGFVLREGVPRPLLHLTLGQLLEGEAAVCLTGPFEARLKSGARAYAGLFRHDTPSPYVPSHGEEPTERQRRARSGSDTIFRTTRLSYVEGVLEAEDASIVGEARIALMRVISHNVDTRERHGSRPVCDTTHCQTFKNSAAPKAGDVEALALPPLNSTQWLPFSQGGRESWREARQTQDVQRAVGFAWATVTSFMLEGATLVVKRTVVEDTVPTEHTERVPCERLRSPLKLPGCPAYASATNTGEVVFAGEGRGHGLGLDVEAAKRSGLSQQGILRAAYPDVPMN